MANKFSKAVFFANNQEFQEGTKEEQEIATTWLDDMLEAITSGSIIAWRHVNLQGEYDFTRSVANDDTFELQQILALKLA